MQVQVAMYATTWSIFMDMFFKKIISRGLTSATPFDTTSRYVKPLSLMYKGLTESNTINTLAIESIKRIILLHQKVTACHLVSVYNLISHLYCYMR